MQAKVKTNNGKNLNVKALVDSGCIHTGIDKQLVKDKRIQTKPLNFSFKVFNADGMKNEEVTRVVPLEIKVNGHKEQLEAAVMEITEQNNEEISKELDNTNPEDLPDYIWPFTYLFNKKKFEKLPERHEQDHKINLTEEAPSELNAKAYTMTLKEEETLNQWLDEQPKAGLIVELKSQYMAPCFYIPKKDGSLQLVQDYRKLNQVIIKDKTSLFLIGEVIDKLKKAKYFNKLDLIWGYNNVRIKEGDEWKATFLTNKRLFEPQVMYFRLCNLPETFQRIMNSIFWELLYEGILANYMDNFVIPAKTKEELEEQTIRFLKIAEKYNLCFKQSKYDFDIEEIPILEVIVGRGQVLQQPLVQ